MFAVKQHEGVSHQHLVSKTQRACDLLCYVFLQGCTFALVEQYSTRSAQGISTARNSSLLPCKTYSYLLNKKTPLNTKYYRKTIIVVKGG